MKAIEINGIIKTFGKVPNVWNDDNGTHFNVGDGTNLGFKNVTIPEYDARIQELSNLHLDGNVYTYDVIDRTISETLAELKENKINDLKARVAAKLSETDWYIIRESDSGVVAPQSVKDNREALRTQSGTIEAQINALTTKNSVILFDINI